MFLLTLLIAITMTTSGITVNEMGQLYCALFLTYALS